MLIKGGDSIATVNLIYQLILVLPLLLTEIFGLMFIYTLFKNDKESKRYLFKLLLSGVSIISIYLMKLILPMTNPFLASPMISPLLMTLQTILCLMIIFNLTASLKTSQMIHKFSCMLVLPFFLGFMSLMGALVSYS